MVATSRTEEKDVIRVGELELRCLYEPEETDGGISMFQGIFPEGREIPQPHVHDAYDETLYVLEGILSCWVEGETVELGPGESVFIPRGVAHSAGGGREAAKVLVFISPGILSSRYFVELGEVVRSGPDRERITEVMKRHGLTPVAMQS